MPEVPISQLSQELVDKIIDDLAESLEGLRVHRWHDLSHCSLVCKSFLPRSQYHIFRTIKIQSEGAFEHELCIKRCEELGRILTQSPHIGIYVQELHLEIQPNDKICLHQTPSFLQAINQLSQAHHPLDKLTLGALFSPCQLGEPQGFLDAFTRLFISPFITSLHIHGINNTPIRMIQECVNLSALTLSGAGLECDSRSNPSRQYVPRPRLRSLKYFESHGAIEKLTGKGFTYHPIHLSTLRALTIYTNHVKDILCMQSIIRATDSLEELYLETQDNICIPPRYFSTSPVYFSSLQLNPNLIPEQHYHWKGRSISKNQSCTSYMSMLFLGRPGMSASLG